MMSQLKSKRIDNFAFCCSLESGGLFFGWFGIISSILTLVFAILFIVLLTQSFITDEGLQQMGFGDQNSINAENMSLIRSVLVGVAVFLIIYAIICFVISVYLIRGTKNQNPKHVLPAVFYFAVSVVSSIVGLYSLSVSAFINAIFNIYAFIVTYSLWRKFKEPEDEVLKELPSAPPATTEQNVN